ncbi:hypothetical protein EFA46_002690 [Halarchaeum sp. CBA1220]|uniref:hypothetical protein n=1 Tax=Halarchaeum sp. CBA1220 TaxID=1853682 RepID=UPI0013148E59|nr:hypothetical protein [Halarchaeum sp. CBA1220]QLC33158.1 hypothetical protein EFA46_002690 [Halarchaeum sp. CBA1220]
MSTASLQRLGLGVILVGGFLTLGSTGTFYAVGFYAMLLGLGVVAIAWLHDVERRA